MAFSPVLLVGVIVNAFAIPVLLPIVMGVNERVITVEPSVEEVVTETPMFPKV